MLDSINYLKCVKNIKIVKNGALSPTLKITMLLFVKKN